MNGENNINGLPIVDTPPENFNNLYGNNTNNQSQGVPNVAPQQPVQPQGVPNIAPQQPVQPQPIPNVAPQQPVQPQPIPNVAPQQPVQPQPIPNVAPQQPLQPQGVPNVAPQQPVQPQGVPNVAPQQPVQPQPNPRDLLKAEQMANNVDIDADRMQSIEEQLSKTSQYNPEDLQQEKITVPTDNQYEKNKSGLTFVIVLFVILALVIAFLPQITKLIG